VRILPEILAVVPPLRMDRQFRELRHSPYISDSLAREFAQVISDWKDRLEPLPCNTLTGCIGRRNTNWHKSAPMATSLEIKWNCDN
jgi:hypothetical protein